MSVQQKLLVGCLALAGLLAAPRGADAQDFALAVSASPNPVVVSNTITYTIYATNRSGANLGPVFVTNSFSDTVLFTGVISSTLPGDVIPNSDSIVFQINTFLAGAVEELVLTFVPETVGLLTNQITVRASTRTSVVTTNVVTQVSAVNADIAVAFVGPANTNVLANDPLAYSLFVTNRGPGGAANVVLSNTLPANFGLLSVTPTNITRSFTNGAWVFALGPLTSNGATQFNLVVQPTNAGPFTLSASVGASSISDPNLTNNVASTNVNIGSYLTDLDEVTSTVVTQRFDFLTGLLHVTVTLTNNSTNDLDATRVLASGLPAGARLYNATGTNNGNGYALYNGPLAAGASIDLVLEFYVLQVSAFTNYTLAAFGVPMINLNAPSSSGQPIEGMAYGPGGFLLKFAATIGKTYTVLYSDDAMFTNAWTAQPSIVAPATQVQWIDNGPPKTTPPGAMRFYRVIQND